MGHATADAMLIKMTECLNSKNIDKSKILQILMDGPSVNWKFHELMEEQISEADENTSTLDNVSSCGLHVVHNAFKTDAKASELNVEEVLSSLYWLFVDSPAQRQYFMEIPGSYVFPLKFCKHRWLENMPQEGLRKFGAKSFCVFRKCKLTRNTMSQPQNLTGL